MTYSERLTFLFVLYIHLFMDTLGAIHRILVVDDEYAIRVLLKNFLENHHYEVKLAEDGVSAVKIFAEFKPELIITDIMMPMENGLEIVSRIRDLNPSINVIYLSAWLDEVETESKVHAELANYPHYKLIQKPFDLSGLLQVIQQLSAAS